VAGRSTGGAYFLDLPNRCESWLTKSDLIGIRPDPPRLAPLAVWYAGGSVSEPDLANDTRSQQCFKQQDPLAQSSSTEGSEGVDIC
jgi:hypothetical protein